jgi:signal transduction histidine kinase
VASDGRPVQPVAWYFLGMVNGASKKTEERSHTDESLQSERRDLDAAIASRLATAEEDADEIVGHARALADAIVRKTRLNEDQQNPPTTTDGGRAAVLKQRGVEDAVLEAERTEADEALRRQREQHARILTALLPLEREKTDRHLLTERIRADADVSNRDDFLGIVSHDLRDLLGALVITATLISKRAPQSEEGAQTRAGAERIHRYVARMNRLIGDLVDVASIDAGKLSVAPVRGDLSMLIAEAVDTFQASTQAKELTLEMDITQRPLMAAFDYDRMLQVLANLITNAIKFTPPGGAIQVSANPLADSVHVSVRDTGVGIPVHLTEAIFERFRQVAGHDRGGMGLGLYISKCLVEAQGGRMWAESQAGEGTTIHVSLPLIDDRRKAHSPNGTAP